MDYPESTSSGIILLYYLVASIIATWRQPKDTLKLSTASQLFLKCTTASILVLSLALCAVDIFKLHSDGQLKVTIINDSLYSDLLMSLQWLVLLLAHIDHPDVVRYPHYGVWVLSIFLRFNGPDRELGWGYSYGDPARYATLWLFVAQFFLTLVLIITTLVLQWTARRRRAHLAATDSETQPLLGNSSTDNKSKDDEEEEEHSRESAEQKKARKELHDRPLLEYLKSFRIYLILLWPEGARQKLYLIGLGLCMLSMRVLTALMPLTLGAIIDALAAGHAPWIPIGAYFTLYFLESRTGIGLLEDYLRLLTSNHQKLRLSRAAYNHVMELSADFQDSKTSSDVWQAMAQAQSVVGLFYSAGFEVGPLLIDLCTGFAIIWAIFGAYMGLLIAVLAVLLTWVCVNSIKSRVVLSRSWRDSYYDSWHQMVDSTQHWFTVSHFDRIPYEKDLFSTKQNISLEGRNKLVYWNYRTNAERFSILTLAHLLAVVLAATAIYNKELSVGAFAMLTGYWNQVSSPIMWIVHQITDVADKLVDAEKLLVLLEKKPTVRDEEGAVPFTYIGGAVDFENVYFTYDNKKTAAEGITFRSGSGKMTAFVGETGGGKSTILKLLMRFYDPEKGRVLIDGQDIRHLQLDTFRKHIAVVPQEPSMFHTTILDNVRYADPSISEEEVQQACEAVALHEKIMSFAKGYQTKVGERGCQLSGGEKQRLAIARAILKKPDILLLDEATSSVDSVTEEKIQKSLDAACRGRTTFVIAHRLSTILKADTIHVVEGGKIVESGAHRDLVMNHGGAYHKLWKSQLKLQGGERGRSRSRSMSKSKSDAQNTLLIDNTGDMASLLDESDTPVEESSVQTPEDDDSGAHDKTVGKGTNEGDAGLLETLRSRLFSRSPAPADQQKDGAIDDDSADDQQQDRRLTKSDPEIRHEDEADE